MLGLLRNDHGGEILGISHKNEINEFNHFFEATM